MVQLQPFMIGDKFIVHLKSGYSFSGELESFNKVGATFLTPIGSQTVEYENIKRFERRKR